MSLLTVVLLGIMISLSESRSYYDIFRKSYDTLASSYLAPTSTYDASNNFRSLVSFDDLRNSRSFVLNEYMTVREEDDAVCSADGCSVTTEETFELSLYTGAMHVFTFSSGNTTIKRSLTVTVPYLSINYALEYLYTQPKHRVYAFLGSSDNSGDSDEFNKQCTEQAITNTGKKPECARNYTRVRYEADTATIKDLGTKLTCGHWTADSLRLYQKRFVIPEHTDNLVYFSTSPEFRLTGTICFQLDGEEADCKEFTGSVNDFPLMVENTMFSVQLSSLSNVPTTLVKNSFAAHISNSQPAFSNAQYTVNEWYVLDSVPTFGAPSATGIGSVQMRQLFYASNFTAPVYAAQSLRGLGIDWGLKSCNTNASSAQLSLKTVVFQGSLFAAITEAARRTIKVGGRTYQKHSSVYKRSGGSRAVCLIAVVVVVTAVVIAGAIAASLAIVANNNSCCVTMGGEVEDHIYQLTLSMNPAAKQLSDYRPSLPDALTLRDGFVVDSSVSYESFKGFRSNAKLSVYGLNLEWSEGDGFVTSWEYVTCYHFTTSGGSYVIINFVIEGDYATVNLISDSMVFSISSETLTYGQIERTYSVYITDPLSDYEICLNNREDCKTPTNLVLDDGATGGENNGDNDGEIGSHSEGSIWKFVWSNIGYGLFTFFVVLFVAGFMFFVCIRLIRILRSFTKGNILTLSLVFYLIMLRTPTTKAFEIYPSFNYLDKTTCAGDSDLCYTLFQQYGVVITDFDAVGTNDKLHHTLELFSSDFDYPEGNCVYCDRMNFTQSTNIILNYDGRSHITYKPRLSLFANYDKDKRYVYTDQVISSFESCTRFNHTNMFLAVADYIKILDKRPALIYRPLEQLSELQWASPKGKIGEDEGGDIHRMSFLSCTRPFRVTDLSESLSVIDRQELSIMHAGKTYKFSVFFFTYFGNFSADDVADVYEQEFGVSNVHRLSVKDIQSADFTTDAAFFGCSGCNYPDDFLTTVFGGGYYLSTREFSSLLTLKTSSAGDTLRANCFYGHSVTYCNGTNYFIISSTTFDQSYTSQVRLDVGSTTNLVTYRGTLNFQVPSICSGSIKYDPTGTLTCVDGCCIVSDDGLRTIHYLTVGTFLPNYLNKDKRVLTMAVEDNIGNVPLTRVTVECSIASFKSFLSCFQDRYTSFFLFLFVMMILALVYFSLRLLHFILSFLNVLFFRKYTLCPALYFNNKTTPYRTTSTKAANIIYTRGKRGYRRLMR